MLGSAAQDCGDGERIRGEMTQLLQRQFRVSGVEFSSQNGGNPKEAIVRFSHLTTGKNAKKPGGEAGF
jgi:hypothetical protein